MQRNHAKLADRDLAILKDRLHQRRSYSELADQYGITAERVRQILNRCVRLISNSEHAIAGLNARIDELALEVRIRDRLLTPPARVQLSWERLREVSVEELHLSPRARHAVEHYEVDTLGELWDKTDAELLEWNRFGSKSLTELRHAMIDLCATHGWTVFWNHMQDCALGRMELEPSKTVEAI